MADEITMRPRGGFVLDDQLVLQNGKLLPLSES